jgi:hypothetical protein
MSVYATIQRAALEAARLAWPGFPEDWVAWDEQPTVQCDIAVILAVVSEPDEDTEPVEIYVAEGAGIRVELVQRALINVDVRIECVFGAETNGLATEERHFLDAARITKMAWSTEYIRNILGAEVVPTGKFGATYNKSADRNGVTLPMCSYEVQFRALVGRLTDPTRRGRITSVAATGTVDGEQTDGFVVGPP